jgi:hypothetical protein
VQPVDVIFGRSCRPGPGHRRGRAIAVIFDKAPPDKAAANVR